MCDQGVRNETYVSTSAISMSTENPGGKNIGNFRFRL
jgi:hypothetical protein